MRKELIERDLGFDAALLSLDLANIYARQGRSAEMRRLAEEMLPIFKSRDIHREAIAALLVFQKSAEMERVTLGLIREVSSYLKESPCHLGTPLPGFPLKHFLPDSRAVSSSLLWPSCPVSLDKAEEGC